MKESPILFSTDMVKAILEGRKTQTRRMIKPQPKENMQYFGWKTPEYLEVAFGKDTKIDSLHKPRFGDIGDMLWVRETFCLTQPTHPEAYHFGYKCGIMLISDWEASEKYDFSKPDVWKPSIHMPKEAARIWLQITDVRVERLQDISDEDAIAEGIEKHPDDKTNIHYRNYHHKDFLMITPKYSFKTLWESIHSYDSWDANPWVWVISYNVLSRNGKPYNI